MNRREAFQTIGAALVGTAAEGASIDAPNSKPPFIVVSLDKDMDQDAISQNFIESARNLIQEACKRAGWGDDFPVVFTGPGVTVEWGPHKPDDISVTIPPNTIVEQLGDQYTVIYPVGHWRDKQAQAAARCG